jgi:hypothetical protein
MAQDLKLHKTMVVLEVQVAVVVQPTAQLLV